jgi:hypothetical protein
MSGPPEVSTLILEDDFCMSNGRDNVQRPGQMSPGRDNNRDKCLPAGTMSPGYCPGIINVSRPGQMSPGYCPGIINVSRFFKPLNREGSISVVFLSTVHTIHSHQLILLQ